ELCCTYDVVPSHEVAEFGGRRHVKSVTSRRLSELQSRNATDRGRAAHVRGRLRRGHVRVPALPGANQAARAAIRGSPQGGLRLSARRVRLPWSTPLPLVR